MEALVDLRRNTNSTNLKEVLNMDAFNNLFIQITEFEDFSEGHFTIEFLKDVSSLLAMLSAVRESTFERQLQSERNMLSLTFAFDHQNYARYGSYQHPYLNNLKISNPQAYEDLLNRLFGGSITGQSFSTIHGDLITELFNGQTKGTAGPFRAGFSTDIGVVNSW